MSVGNASHACLLSLVCIAAEYLEVTTISWHRVLIAGITFVALNYTTLAVGSLIILCDPATASPSPGARFNACASMLTSMHGEVIFVLAQEEDPLLAQDEDMFLVQEETVFSCA